MVTSPLGKKEDEPKEEAHEDVEHIQNLIVVEDCSTSWSSNDDRYTQEHLTRLMMTTQVMQLMILLQAHLMILMMVHAWMILLLQAHPYHYIASCHKVTQRYQVAM
jgi:hypothetical protein